MKTLIALGLLACSTVAAAQQLTYADCRRAGYSADLCYAQYAAKPKKYSYVQCTSEGGTMEYCKQFLDPAGRAYIEKREAVGREDAQRHQKMMDQLKPKK